MQSAMKVAIVTGAGRGIGRAEATQLAADGFVVVVNDIGVGPDGAGGDQRPADRVVAEIVESGGRALPDYTDITRADDVDAMVARVVDEFGRLDAVVNNAGVLTPHHVLPDTPLDGLRATIETHVLGSFYTSIAATRHWRDVARRQGSAVDARLVNTASESYLSGAPWHVDYTAAKSAVVGLTIGSASTCIKFGVRVNAICPRAFTRMTTSVLSDDPSNAADHVGTLVAALCGPRGSNINGQVLIVGGGHLSVLSGPTEVESFPNLVGSSATEMGEVLATYFERTGQSYAPPLGSGARLLDDLRPRFDFLEE